MKKILVTVFLLTTTLFSIWAGGRRQTPAAPAGGGKPELSVWTSWDFGDDKRMVHWQEAEKRTGIHINFSSNKSDSNEALNLMIASGDLPDILGVFFSPEQYLMMAEGGTIIPIENYIDGTDSNYKKGLAEYPEYRKFITAPNGHIYSFPYADSSVQTMPAPMKMWVRSDWLKKLNISMPNTTEELRAMLRAFKDRDPNGNGRKDEMGLLGYNPFWDFSDPIMFLMAPFQLYHDNFHVISGSGQVQFVADTDGWREGLRYINSLYREGLVEPVSWVHDMDQAKTLVSKPASDAVAGAFVGRYVYSVVGPPANWTDFEAVPPLRGPTGLRQTAALNEARFRQHNAITTACKNPELAFKWLDWWLTDEANMFSLWGAEGIHYDLVDQESFYGTKPAVKLRPNIGVPPDDLLAIMDTGLIPRFDKASIRYAGVNDPSTRNVDESYMDLEAAKRYEPYYVWHNIPQIVWCTDTDLVNRKNDYQTNFNSYVNTEALAFITGEKDINSNAAWNAYKQGLLNLGLNDYLAVLKKYYGL
ncbi:MAG: extracellular solute-binding protein [Spirochaetaceae bacterium]|jgi:putative aldouronate transport system substrate-binding protein|nr:extracellular solute-binding protein [Spirochaetaceae bacterium]